MFTKLAGLVAATHTPFDNHGDLNLSVIERQASHLDASGVKTVFIGGSTGESHSLAVDERLELARRWSEVVAGSDLKWIAHVGSNCLRDAKVLARQAEERGAIAISALAPSYFKPKSLDVMINCCEEIAGAAPETPFYFYDIPSMTGVSFAMAEFLEIAIDRIPTLAGIKFTNPDLMSYQLCLNARERRFDLPWGNDEYLLAALALGATSAVGSSYNFAGPLHNAIIASHRRGDSPEARALQFRSVKLIQLLASFGYMGAAKATMGFLGVNVGDPRLPNAALSSERKDQLRSALEGLGFFDWVRPASPG